MLTEAFVLRAAAGAVLLVLVAAPLGCFVVWRRMAYFGEAMAHSTLLGIALGLALSVPPLPAVIGLVMVLTVLFVLLERRGLLAGDALLGLLAHGALAFGMIAVALIGGVRVDLMGYLFGDMLAIGPADLWVLAALAAGGGGLLVRLWRPLLSATVHADLAAVEGVPVERVRLVFMLLTAVVVAVGMKVVGLLLVVALLIVPAAAARPLARTPDGMAGLAMAAGTVAVLAGLGGSLQWDLPAGPAVVAASILVFVASGVAAALLRRGRAAAGRGVR
jgi:zinc transport system permease protein